jgi:hypothetical protein
MLHQDGMDLYANVADFAMNYSLVSNLSLSTTGGRFGGGALVISNYNSKITYSFSSNQTEIWVGFAVYVNSGQSYGVLLGIVGASGVEATFNYDPATSTLTVYRGDGSVSLKSESFPLGNEIWHWVEFHYLMSSTNGTMEAWLDGTQVINVTGVNTTYYNSSSFVGVYICTSDNGYSLYTAYVDDLYILNTSGSVNNGRLGDSRIITLEATSDASPNNGTPYSGSTHYGAIDEAQWSSSNYLTITNTSGQEELFGFASMAISPQNIWNVRVLSVAEKTDSGAASAEMVVSSSGVVANGGSQSVLTSWSVLDGLFSVDPNTSSQWTTSAVNSLKAGYKVP